MAPPRSTVDPVNPRPILVVGAPGTPLTPLELFFSGLKFAVQSLADDIAEGALLGLLQPGVAVTAYLPYHPGLSSALAERATRVILVERDPRDVACALAGRSLAVDERSGGVLRDRLRVVVGGESVGAALSARLKGYRAWRRHPGVLTIRYEDVIGPRLGGDEAVQIETLLGLAAALDWRGSALMLGRTLTLVDLPAGRDGPWDEVAAWSRCLPASAHAPLDETLREEIVAGGYDGPLPGSEPGPSGALTGLLAAMANEHEVTLAALSGRPDGPSPT